MTRPAAILNDRNNTIIRACQLQEGDRFIKQSVTHRVVKIVDGSFMCRHVSCYDNGDDGHKRKVAYGVVTEIGDESFVVQWSDLEDPTEYEWATIEIIGRHILQSNKKRKNNGNKRTS